MTKSETTIRFHLLIEIASKGMCTLTDSELAALSNTTETYVAIVIKQMEVSREIRVTPSEGIRQIKYFRESTCLF
jgi:hypothetical protein